MWTKTGIEREHYEARRKAQLDHNSAMGFARTVGSIQICQRLLKLPQSSEAELLRLPSDDLMRLAEDLEKQAMNCR